MLLRLFFETLHNPSPIQRHRVICRLPISAPLSRKPSEAGRAILRRISAVLHFIDQSSLAPRKPRKARVEEPDVAGAKAVRVHNSRTLAARELLQRDRKAAFAVAATLTPTGMSFSLRSESWRDDVSAIAKLYGGGGHRNAASFSLPAADGLRLLVV